jgi:flagellar hook-associated protein FlgK
MYPTALNVAASGLIAQQNNLDTISKNIANKDVEGYKRLNHTFSTIPNNGGVQYTASSNNYPWVDNNLAEKSTELSRQLSLQDGAESLDNLFMNNNVEEAYSSFMNASKNLQMFPESKQYLEEFNSTGKFLNDSINQMSEGLNGVQRNVKNKIELNKIELDSLKSQLTQISSRGINESNMNNVQLLQQRIAKLTGSISGYNEFINNIVPPITYNYKKATGGLLEKINESGKSVMFANNEWVDQVAAVDNVAINNESRLINFGDEFGRMKVDVGVNSNTLLLGTKFARNQWEQAISDYDKAYGVNLEQEVVNMMQAQRMYEANTKVLKTADNMIGSLLNAIG